MSATGSRRYRAAVIGGGRIGALAESDRRRIAPSTHAGAYLGHPRTELVGIVEPEDGKHKDLEALYPGVSIYRSQADLMLEQRPEIVSVATPAASHGRNIRGLRGHGVRAILCEKPLVRTLREAERLVDMCREDGTLLCVNHLRRCNPLVQRVKATLEGGEMGEVVRAVLIYTGGLLGWGTHGIDLLVHCLGHASAVRGLHAGTEPDDPADPNVEGWIDFESGCRATLVTSNFSDHRIFELDFIGRRGRIRLVDLGFRAEFFGVAEGERFTQPELKIRAADRSTHSTFLPVVDHLVGCLDGREEPLLRAEDALHGMRLIHALLKSARAKGRAVSVAPPRRQLRTGSTAFAACPAQDPAS